MKKPCPDCSSKNVKYIRKDMPQPTPVVFLALGGIIFSMIYGSSRPWIIQCSDCKTVYKRHSFFTILAQPFFWLYMLFYAAVVLGLLFVIAMLIFE